MSDYLFLCGDNVNMNNYVEDKDIYSQEGYICQAGPEIVTVNASSQNDDRRLYVDSWVSEHLDTVECLPGSDEEDIILHGQTEKASLQLRKAVHQRAPRKNKTNKGNDCTKLTDIMPETKIPLFLRKKADSVLRNESKDKTEKASSSAPNRSCFADKIQELRNLLPDNISDSCGMNSAVLQATIAYIKLLKRKDSNVNRLAKKLEMCNLEVRKLMRRLETLENLYSANPINN